MPINCPVSVKQSSNMWIKRPHESIVNLWHHNSKTTHSNTVKYTVLFSSKIFLTQSWCEYDDFLLRILQATHEKMEQALTDIFRVDFW